ncbi:hypothetical protein PSHI8_15300 [Polynucleobacter sp. SHI8]|uniref:RDD family protein n=1 Tax=unclassified Polynucleobacter TaxID=2640945 RepID=UPI0024915B9E|nr:MULTISPECIES: RDD family protein [unclassified Polynucleobacter]BDW11447.1 hypothetical protein PSHI2_15290 [Polynucleobacter sp. SHI2]BDW13894.1 hypothetical protein PSHI8_15300 [Polynucleobacter sp. SHI8]
MRYAGFWIRFVAYIIDTFILSTVLILLGTIWSLKNDDSSVDLATTIAQSGMVLSISFFLHWFYFAIMESSESQATLGKKILGLKVTDEFGQRMSFGRATGRYFSKFISSLILGIGYIMAAFTDRKQALHDKIASTLVIYSSGTVSSVPVRSGVGYGTGNSGGASAAYTTRRDNSPNASKQIVLSGFDVNNKGFKIRLTFDKNDARLIQEGLKIGRDQAVVDLHINNNSVSRQHAKILMQGGELMIEDLNSTNGTIVNGKKLPSNVLVSFPDRGRLLIGDVELSIGEF